MAAVGTGQRDNPTIKHLIAIARFFGVPPTYFFPDDAMQQGAVPAELAAALSDDKVRENGTARGRAVGTGR